MGTEHASYYREFLIILAVAGIAVPLFIRIGVSAVLGFLIVGVVLSTGVLGKLAASFPALQTFVLVDSESFESLAELGVVFLLFLVGLEISFERLMTMRRLVFGLGSLQVVLTMMGVVLAGWGFGFGVEASIVFGLALSLSSTAIVIQLLSDEKRLGSQTGRFSFAVLLFQDLAVVPILLLVSIMGHEGEGPIFQDVVTALAQAGLAILVIVGVGRYALRPLLRLVAKVNSPDLFMATTLLIAVGTGVLANLAGLSMALGAFIAGLMLAETEFRRAIESIIEPFKGLLLGTFFLLVGMKVDLAVLAESPFRIIGVALALVAFKAALIYGLARIFGIGRAVAIESALLLGPCGEFGFVVMGSALALGIVTEGITNQLLLVISLTMVLIPVFARLGRIARSQIQQPVVLDPEARVAPPEHGQPRVIVAGFGRVGHLIGSMLKEHEIPYIAIDSDPDLVARERRNGHPVYYGDATSREFLRHCGIDHAHAIAVTMDAPARVDEVTRVAHSERGDLKIIARARDERHAMALYLKGATEAVPETIEASLQLGEAILVESGIPMGLAIAAVHERRDGFRKLLNRPNRREELKLLRNRRRKVS